MRSVFSFSAVFSATFDQFVGYGGGPPLVFPKNQSRHNINDEV